MDDIDKFWSYVDRSEGPLACWPWTRSRSAQGYGQLYPHRAGPVRRKVYAHRWILGYLRGLPLVGQPVGAEDGCHRCDNPPCCNPAHLYIGTRRQNVADAVARTRLWMLKRTSCPQGHPYDATNTYLNPAGSRKCRTCRAAADRQAKQIKMADRTHCKNGHILGGANVLLCRNGTRKCRVCDEARQAKTPWAHRMAS